MSVKMDDIVAKMDPQSQAWIKEESARLIEEYQTLQKLRQAQDLTQVQLAETLGVQQATVAKYEKQTDLLLSTLARYVSALGGTLKLTVEFPGRPPVLIEGLADQSRIRRRS